MTTISTTTGPPTQGVALARPVSAPTQPVLPVVSPSVPAVATPVANKTAAKSITASKTSTEDIKRLSDNLQSRFNQIAPELQISVDQSSGRTVIKFTDRSTNKVIRQFPTEEALQLNKDLERFQKGLLLNKNA